MEGAESSRWDDNKRVEDARRARVQWLQRLQTECSSEEEFNTARSRPMWAELDVSTIKTPASTGLDSASCSSSLCASDGPPSEGELESVRHENRLLFQQLLDSQPQNRRYSNSPKLRHIRQAWDLIALDGRVVKIAGGRPDHNLDPFFIDCGGCLEVGGKIGGGGQADIHYPVVRGKHLFNIVLKVFKSDYSLVDLQRSWMKNMALTSKFLTKVHFKNCCTMMHGTLLEDGRFAFVMRLYWSDLRKEIDHRIVEDKTHRKPLFTHIETLDILYGIANGMKGLHENGILHRDLKAANCLLHRDLISNVNEKDSTLQYECVVADFDSPEGVLGTRFWRAPEILLGLKNRVRDLYSNPQVWTKKVDVYSYAMTCYEVLTGCIPFEDRGTNDYDGVIGGERPPLPDYVDVNLRELVERCWHPEPSRRPTFIEIVDKLWMIYPETEI